MLDMGFDLMRLLFDKPLRLWAIGAKFLSTSLMNRLPLLRKIAGIMVILMIMNFIVFYYIRATDIFVKIWKVLKWACKLPLIALVIAIVKLLFKFFLSIPEKEEEEREDKKKREKKTSFVLLSSSRLIKELGNRLLEAEKEECATEKQDSQNEEEGESCPHCGKEGHEESMCQLRIKTVHEWKRGNRSGKKSEGKG